MNRTDIDRGLTSDVVDQVRMAEHLLTRDEFGNLVRNYRPRPTEAQLRQEGAWIGLLVVILLLLAGWVALVGIN